DPRFRGDDGETPRTMVGRRGRWWDAGMMVGHQRWRWERAAEVCRPGRGRAIVIPAKAGIQGAYLHWWIPAFAGMTGDRGDGGGTRGWRWDAGDGGGTPGMAVGHRDNVEGCV